MLSKSIITEDSHFFKKGQIVEGELTQEGLMVENHFIAKESYIILTEVLTLQDEEKVRQIVRDIMRRLFYRQYVRANFLLK